jgi:hypothetical protein
MLAKSVNLPSSKPDVQLTACPLRHYRVEGRFPTAIPIRNCIIGGKLAFAAPEPNGRVFAISFRRIHGKSKINLNCHDAQPAANISAIK